MCGCKLPQPSETKGAEASWSYLGFLFFLSMKRQSSQGLETDIALVLYAVMLTTTLFTLLWKLFSPLSA